MADRVKRLKTVPIFADVGRETLLVLSKLLKEERYAKGEYVVHEGESADAMYVLQSGELEVRKVISRKPYNYKTLAILEQNDVFGEMAVFGSEKRSADVITRMDSVLWKLSYSELRSMIKKDPASSIKTLQVIMRILVSRIERLNSELVTLYELGRILPYVDDVKGLTRVVFEQAMNAIEPAQNGFMAILNIFNEEFDIYQSTDKFKEKHIQYTDPVSAWMFENKAPLIVRDSASEPQFKEKFYAGRSFIACPILHNENLLGFMLFNSSKKNAFNYSNMILLSTLCTQTGAKLNDISRREEELMRQRLNNGKLAPDMSSGRR